MFLWMFIGWLLVMVLVFIVSKIISKSEYFAEFLIHSLISFAIWGGLSIVFQLTGLMEAHWSVWMSIAWLLALALTKVESLGLKMQTPALMTIAYLFAFSMWPAAVLAGMGIIAYEKGKNY